MKIQLFSVGESSEIGTENLGISRIAKFLRMQNYEVKISYLYMDLGVEHAIANIDHKYDMFGFSCYGDYLDFIFCLSKYIKTKINKSFVFLGSRFATDCAELILEEAGDIIDFIVLGHGEYPLLQFLNDIKTKSLHESIKNNQNIISAFDKNNKKICNSNINSLPLPDREYLNKKNKLYANICSAHGCLGACSFCTINNEKSKWSGRSPQDIVAEIQTIYKNTKLRFYSFVDPSFEDPGIDGKKRIEELCVLLLNEPIKYAFTFYLRANTFTYNDSDIKLLKLMKNAGFCGAFLGIEAGNDDDLKIYKKLATLEDNNNIISLLNDVGITPLVGFIMFNPYSTKEKLIQNYNFLINHKISYLDNYIRCLIPHYNSSIYRRAKKDNLIKNDYNYKMPYWSFNCEDEIVNKIMSFVHNKFFNNQNMTNFILDHLYIKYFLSYIKTIYKDAISFEGKLKEIENELFELHKLFFYDLYYFNDIEKCEYNYNDYEMKLKNCHINIENIKNKTLRYIIKSE